MAPDRSPAVTDEVAPALADALSDRYRLERELGRGGMATVYLARDLKHDRSVALKVIHPELAAVIGAERFLAEIKVTADLNTRTSFRCSTRGRPRGCSTT